MSPAATAWDNSSDRLGLVTCGWELGSKLKLAPPHCLLLLPINGSIVIIHRGVS